MPSGVATVPRNSMTASFFPEFSCSLILIGGTESKGIPAEIQALFLPTVMIDLNQQRTQINAC